MYTDLSQAAGAGLAACAQEAGGAPSGAQTAPGPASRSRRVFLGQTAATAAGGLALTPLLARSATAELAPSGESIDAHIHVFPAGTDRYPLKPGATPNKRPLPSFTPEEFLKHAAPVGVTRAVLIQFSHYGYDNSYILDTMRQHAGRFAVVAGVDPQDKPRDKIRELAGQGARGVRVASAGRTPDDWGRDTGLAELWRAAGEAGLVVCALVGPEFLPAVERFCQQNPQTTVALDHLARIGADGTIRSEHVDALCGLARHKQIHVKVSAFYALGAKAPPYQDLGPMIRRVVDAFGAERLLWGSDSPFQTLAPHTYRDSIELLHSRLDFLSAQQRRCLLADTAARLFFR